ncbi:MAG: hypothetical protein ACW963_09005 [Candidatus Sifarchaeia archaeon]|jgi:hypothetical protein
MATAKKPKVTNVDFDIVPIECRGSMHFNTKIKGIIKQYGPKNVEILSTGMYLQGQATSYWAILAVGKTKLGKITT